MSFIEKLFIAFYGIQKLYVFGLIIGMINDNSMSSNAFFAVSSLSFFHYGLNY